MPFNGWFRQAKGVNLHKSCSFSRIKILHHKGLLARTVIDNRRLVEENEELRLFALDEMEMAKSAADLAGKGNALNVDIVDKSDSTKKLLNENERLTQRLDAAQKEAQGLV